MLEIPPEFILKTLKNAYNKYDKYNTLRDETKKIKIYGFCDGLEKLMNKFAPEYSDEINKMKAQSKISNILKDNADCELDRPTIFRKE